MRDPLKPPVKAVRDELVKAALRVARLRERIRRRRRELEDLDRELLGAMRSLRDLATDAGREAVESLRPDDDRPIIHED